MSTIQRVLHGEFGRAMLLTVERPVSVLGYRTCHLLFRVEGPEIVISTRAGRRRLGEGQVLLMNRWEPYDYEVAAKVDPVTMLVLHLEPAWLRRQNRRFSEGVRAECLTIPGGLVPASARTLVQELHDEVVHELMPGAVRVERLAVALATALIVRRSDPARHFRQDLGGIACDARIRNALSALRDSMSAPVAVDRLAMMAGMSRSRFFQLFKQETQLTPMAYLNIERMAEAIRQLSETRDSLFEIASRLGFESPGNFTRFFRMHEGVSPSEYRRRVTVVSRAASGGCAREGEGLAVRHALVPFHRDVTTVHP